MAEVSQLNDQATTAIELRQHAEKEVGRLREALQAKETGKLMLLPKVQELTAVVDCWRSTMITSADDCLNRLKLELHAVMTGSFYRLMQAY